MEGTVYRIDFPTGEFYIGSTKLSLKNRFQGHRASDNPGYVNIKSKLISKYSLKDLISMTSVLYIGEDFRHYEAYLIDHNQDSINIIQPKYSLSKALVIKDTIEKYKIKFKKNKEYKGAFK